MAQQVQDFVANIFQLHAKIHQHLSSDAFLFTQQAQQQMLGADVVMVEVACLFHRVFDDLLRTRRLRQLAHRDHVWSRLDNLLHFEADLSQIDVQILQHVGSNA
jgi:hypothetical protein